jgi:hypothetical protein
MAFVNLVRELNTFSTQVEATQFIACKGIGSTLQYNCPWSIPFHDLTYNRLKDTLVRFIVNAISQWEIDSVVFSGSYAVISKISCPREIFSILVK